jgi:hypothetical protein
MSRARSTDRDGFTRVHAIALIWIGWTIVGATMLGAAVLGVAAGAPALRRAFVAVGTPDEIAGLLAVPLIFAVGAILGLGIGTPFIVAGELIVVGLDQRRLLAQQGRMLHQLRRRLAPPRSEADRGAISLVNRLSPR